MNNFLDNIINYLHIPIHIVYKKLNLNKENNLMGLISKFELHKSNVLNNNTKNNFFIHMDMVFHIRYNMYY